ncbi:MAG: cupredoxin domain-containing protein [Rhodospirillaceae bacterium]|nr:cupredoxin domain-containing protein [Rhodospirillaceae bacterium]
MTLFVFLMTVALAAEPVVVTQKGKAFSQSEITLPVGGSVEFVNDDDTAHNVLSFTPGFEFDLKLQRPGERKVITFDTPGRVEIECDIHPKMGLVITVQ